MTYLSPRLNQGNLLGDKEGNSIITGIERYVVKLITATINI